MSADYGPLADDDHVVAWASEEASVMIADEEGTDEDDVVFYEDERIPLISQDGNVIGIGSAGSERRTRRLPLRQRAVRPQRLGRADGTQQHGPVGREPPAVLGPREPRDVCRYAEDHGYDLQALEEFDADGTVLEFYSTASQISADGDALTEDDLAGDDDRSVLAWAEATATNVDGTDEGAYIYGDDERIPLITRDGNVVGFGAPFAEDESDRDDNREFVLNVWDDVVDGETVYWDESHGQYYDASQFEGLVSDAEAAGYTVEPTDDLLAVLGGVRTMTRPATPTTRAVTATPMTRATVTESRTPTQWSSPPRGGVHGRGTHGARGVRRRWRGRFPPRPVGLRRPRRDRQPKRDRRRARVGLSVQRGPGRRRRDWLG